MPATRCSSRWNPSFGGEVVDPAAEFCCWQCQIKRQNQGTDYSDDERQSNPGTIGANGTCQRKAKEAATTIDADPCETYEDQRSVETTYQILWRYSEHHQQQEFLSDLCILAELGTAPSTTKPEILALIEGTSREKWPGRCTQIA